MKKKCILLTAVSALFLCAFFLHNTYKSKNIFLCENVEALTSGDGVTLHGHTSYLYDGNSNWPNYINIQPGENKYDSNGEWYLWGGFCDYDNAGDEDVICQEIIVWGN